MLPSSLLYAGSASCIDCHADAARDWSGSHHAKAQRPIDPELDGPAFDPAHTIAHGKESATAQVRDGRFALTTTGPDGQPHDFEPVQALAVFPLWQYLIPFPGGRLQATELAWDPARKEWFNVYGDQARQHWEWGHWTQRGMNWNAMCATCHTTDFRKNYQPETDAYASTYAELGVGCEQCHGPMKPHVIWQHDHEGLSGDPTLEYVDRDQHFATCGACHTRRGDLTGRFQPGEAYLDHFEPTLPDATDVFYPDGQVRDEDFEYVPFMLSYMHGQNVRCVDCHHYHTGKVNLPGNKLCLRCHEQPVTKKIAIDSDAHSHHAPETPGWYCIDCHMPVTHYMERHPRHDHGMTVPDPLMTREFGIPNACTRCHEKEGVDWSIEKAVEWYGDRLDRPARQRTRLLASIRNGDTAAIAPLLDRFEKEPNPTWRAVYIRFLVAALGRVDTPDRFMQGVSKIEQLVHDEHPLIRATAIEALAGIYPTAAEHTADSLDHPVRLVRLKAAWAMRSTLPETHPVHAELMDSLRINQDQPLGAFQWAHYFAARQQPEQAIPWFEKAIRWDPGAAGFRHDFAVVLSGMGRMGPAIEQMRKATEIEPDAGLHRYGLGLLYAEQGRLPEARDALAAAAERDPGIPRFWYNLALAESRLGHVEPAVMAMYKAEALAPSVVDYPYTRATILLQANDVERAREALSRALQIDPQHLPSLELLGKLR